MLIIIIIVTKMKEKQCEKKFTQQKWNSTTSVLISQANHNSVHLFLFLFISNNWKCQWQSSQCVTWTHFSNILLLTSRRTFCISFWRLIKKFSHSFEHLNKRLFPYRSLFYNSKQTDDKIGIFHRLLLAFLTQFADIWRSLKLWLKMIYCLLKWVSTC